MSDDARESDAHLLLERERFEFEREMRGRELLLREEEARRHRRWSPLVIAIFTAAAAGLANLGVTYLNGRAQAGVEALRGEQALVLEAIKTGGDVGKAEANLRFLAKAGLLKERGADINRALDQGDRPALPGAGTALGTGAGTENRRPAARAPADCLARLHLRVPGESYNSPITRSGIRTFQQREGLEQTGLLDEATHSRALSRCAQAP